MAVNPIPPGYEGVTPYLIVKDAAAAIDFYKKALGAVEIMRFNDPQGRIGHAELKIGQAIIMLADEHPERGYSGPKTIGGSPVSLMLYVPDVDKTARDMAAAGGTEDRPVQNQFYGDRTAGFTDPFGHIWHIATHVEDVPPEELEKRAAALHDQTA